MNVLGRVKTDIDQPSLAQDIHWMNMALDAAQLASEQGEVPVGAVLVHQDALLATSANQPIGLSDPTAHAEILVLRQACQKLDNYRLPPGCTLYVTLEPCVMCLGACLHARVDRLVFAAKDERVGWLTRHISEDPRWSDCNHAMSWAQLAAPSSCSRAADLLRVFFKKRR